MLRALELFSGGTVNDNRADILEGFLQAQCGGEAGSGDQVVAAGVAVGQRIIFQHEADDGAALLALVHSLEGGGHVDLLIELGVLADQTALDFKAFLLQCVLQQGGGLELFPAYFLEFPDLLCDLMDLFAVLIDDLHHPLFIRGHFHSSISYFTIKQSICFPGSALPFNLTSSIRAVR